MDHEQPGNLAAETGPAAVLLPRTGQLRGQGIEFAGQPVERDLVLRRGDHGVDCGRPGRAEAQPQLVFQIAQIAAAFDRAARGEGDQQGLGPGRVAFSGGGLQVDPRQPLFERRDLLFQQRAGCRNGGCAGRRAGGRGGTGQRHRAVGPPGQRDLAVPDQPSGQRCPAQEGQQGSAQHGAKNPA